MVKHLVLWKLKPEAHGQTAAENARAIKQQLEDRLSRPIAKRDPRVRVVSLHER